MKAAQLLKYDKNFQLVVQDIPVPKPKENEVLIQVKAAAVNPLESLIGTGSVKLIQDYSMPLTMGNELSGVVTAVGSKVTVFKVDDAVYARLPLNKIGAFAEYVAVDYRAVAFKPDNLDFIQSAAVPLTGLTAYQGLTEELNVQPGQSVMIPGGSGSFGQMAVPLAKKMDLKVFVSGNARSKDATLAMGVDQYFDYREENYWEHLTSVDYVIDTIGKKEFAHELQILKTDGKLLSLIMGPNRHFAKSHHLSFLKTALFSMAGLSIDRQAKSDHVQYHFIFVRSDGAQLKEITEIVEAKNIHPAVDPTHFELDDINKALHYLTHDHPKGKVIITF